MLLFSEVDLHALVKHIAAVSCFQPEYFELPSAESKCGHRWVAMIGVDRRTFPLTLFHTHHIKK